MSLTVAVQMDHIAGINIAGDSTFALMLEAKKRGHALIHYHVRDLAQRGRDVFVTGEPVEVRDEKGNHFSLGERTRMRLDEAQVVLMRQDPPFDMDYITATHMLECVHPKTLVVNDPASVRNAPEKIFVTEFSQFMPPTLITRNVSEIEAFRTEFSDIVIKPLYGNGGKAVFRLKPGDENFGSLIDMFESTFREPWVIQQYREEVRQGDKRILIVDGKFAGAVNRVPAEGDLRSNMVRGGVASETDLTPREREIVEALGPVLKEKGLIFTGIDVIGGYLTEINVTSPTGIRAIAKLGGPDAAAMIWDAIEEKVG
ncbi:glutathione synthase [Tepidamorphus sp. 3E244]|uniref:glutathione synthase n=1 Tax=Tepidamorphus sp. 3E244 TaxID=3385498 RepID=UPI0038FCFB9D